MANKSKKQDKGVAVRVHVPGQLNEKIERYRAQKRVDGIIPGTKEETILELTEEALTK